MEDFRFVKHFRGATRMSTWKLIVIAGLFLLFGILGRHLVDLGFIFLGKSMFFIGFIGIGVIWLRLIPITYKELFKDQNPK
jgi:cyanate permease